MRKEMKKDLFVMFVCAIMIMVATLSGCGEKYNKKVRDCAQTGIDVTEDYLTGRITMEELHNKCMAIADSTDSTGDLVLATVKLIIADIDMDAVLGHEDDVKEELKKLYEYIE